MLNFGDFESNLSNFGNDLIGIFVSCYWCLTISECFIRFGDVMEKEKVEWKSVRLNFSDEDEFKAFKAFESGLVINGKTFMGWLGQTLYDNGEEYVGKEVENIVTMRELLDSAELVGISIYPKLLELIRGRSFEKGVDYWSADGGERKVYRYDKKRCLAKLVARAKVMEGKKLEK